MAKFTYDLKVACQVSLNSSNANNAEAMLPDLIDSINGLLSQFVSAHESLLHIYLEIDDCDGPMLLDEDDNDS